MDADSNDTIVPPMADDLTNNRIAAWAAHLFTATGVVLAMLALAAIDRGAQGTALLWLLAAIIVDGVDGTFARMVRVKEQLPRIDGEALDLIIDYLTYVFLPVLFIWRGGFLPPSIAPYLVGAILVSSLYTFARRDMKTDDGYFRGFPALWIGVAFFLFALQPGPTFAAVVVVLLIVATFAPIHFIHPFRAKDYGALPVGLTAFGASASIALLLQDWHPTLRALLVAIAIGSAAALVVLGLSRTVRGPRP